MGPGEGHRADHRTGAPPLEEEVERIGAVQPGEEKALKRPQRTFQCLKGLKRDFLAGLVVIEQRG